MSIRTNSFMAWVLAARPKTLAGAVGPVLMATALAWAHGHFQLLPALLCLLFAVGMQIAANFINDRYDYLKGSDREDRLGPERACAQGWITAEAMRCGVMVSIAFSCLCGLGLVATGWGMLPYGGVELIVVGALCVLFAFLYTTLLSYNGCGDLLVLLFFGIVPVCGTYYVQAYTLTPQVWLVSVAIGLVTDTLLVLNNYRDREQDAKSHKQTLVVRFGERFGHSFYLMLGVVGTWMAMEALGGAHGANMWSFAMVVYLALHMRTWRTMKTINHGKELNTVLAMTARNILLFALLFAAALIKSM